MIIFMEFLQDRRLELFLALLLLLLVGLVLGSRLQRALHIHARLLAHSGWHGRRQIITCERNRRRRIIRHRRNLHPIDLILVDHIRFLRQVLIIHGREGRIIVWSWREVHGIDIILHIQRHLEVLSWSANVLCQPAKAAAAHGFRGQMQITHQAVVGIEPDSGIRLFHLLLRLLDHFRDAAWTVEWSVGHGLLHRVQLGLPHQGAACGRPRHQLVRQLVHVLLALADLSSRVVVVVLDLFQLGALVVGDLRMVVQEELHLRRIRRGFGTVG